MHYIDYKGSYINVPKDTTKIHVETKACRSAWKLAEKRSAQKESEKGGMQKMNK